MAENGKWQNRIIETVQMRVGDLAVNKYNPKVHPVSQETRVEAVLEKFGIVDSLIAWRSDRNGGQWTIFDGHLRQKLDPDQVWTVHKTSLRDEEVDELVFYFDPLAGMSLHDEARMTALMQDLGDVDGVLGEMLGELAEGVGLIFGGGALTEVPEPQLDRAAELQEVWQVKRGQVWEIPSHSVPGKAHRLMCGDSTDAGDVGWLMGEEKVNYLFTSPPYWVGKEYEKQRTEAQIDAFVNACVRAWTDFVFVDYGRIGINTGTAAIHRIEKRRKVEVLPLIDKWQEEFRQRGWLARHFRIWAKSGDFPARISPRTDVVDQRWEHIVTFDSEWSYLGTWWAPTGRQRGQEKIGTPWAQQGVWLDIRGDRSAGGRHVAAFPVELPRRNILLYTKKSEGILDPFLGSGTTIAACELTARTGFGMEISEKYCSVALQRLKDMGLEPRLVEG